MCAYKRRFLIFFVEQVVAPAIRAIVGAGEDDLLKRFAQLGQDELHVAACASVASIHLRLQAVHRQVHDAAIAESKHLEALAKDPGKFSVFKMAAGTIDDFHKGLMDRIGQGLIVLQSDFSLDA
jgi:hypothetical protein